MKFRSWIILYLMSLIIGAGILSLPYAAIKVGFPVFVAISLLVMFLYMGVYKHTVMSVYKHVQSDVKEYLDRISPAYTGSAHRGLVNLNKLRDVGKKVALERRMNRSKSGIYVELLSNIKMRHANLIVGTYYVFMLLACLGFTIPFINIGSITLKSLATYTGNGIVPVLMITAGIVMFLVAILLIALLRPHGKPLTIALIAILFMASVWIFGTGLLSTVDLPLLSVGLFIFAAVIGKTFAVLIKPKTEKREEGELTSDHKKSALMTLLQLVMLFATILIAFVSISKNPGWLSTVNLDPYAIMSLVGVLFFAYAGPMYMLVMYVEVHKNEKIARQVVWLVPFIVFLIYTAFTVAILAVVPPDILAAADAAQEQVIIPLAALIQFPPAQLAVIVLGYSYVLISVTNAYIGYVDIIADTIQGWIIRKGKKGMLSTKTGQYLLWLVFMVISIIITTTLNMLFPTSLSTIIGFIGGIGAGVYMIAIPFVLPEEGNTPSRKNIGLFIIMLIVSVAVTVLGIL